MTIRRGLSASGKRALLRRADPWGLATVKVTRGKMSVEGCHDTSTRWLRNPSIWLPEPGQKMH